MTKLESSGLFLTYQAPGCQDVNAQQWQRSPLLKHTQMLCTHTHRWAGKRLYSNLLCYNSQNVCKLSPWGWGVLQKNLIAKAFICQPLALKWFPTPIFSCSLCMTLTGCCFMLTKKHVKSVAGEADREECVFVMFDVFAVGAVGWGGNFLELDPCDIWPFVFKRSIRCGRPHPAEFWVCGLFKC